MRNWLFTVFLCLFSSQLYAANHYVRAGATGNNSGSDWANACPAFTGSCSAASLVRGDTYYVAAGNYAPLDITSPDSGTLIITVKAATVDDHGTSTGWSDAYAGQAVFTTAGHQNMFETDYITIDGQSRTGWGSGYHIKFRNTALCNTCAAFELGNSGAAHGGSASTHDIVEYVEMEGSGSTRGKDVAAVIAVNGSYNQFLYDWFHDAGNDLLQAHTGGWTNLTVDHCFFDTNDLGGVVTGKHSTGLNVTGGNLTVSNNRFRDVQSSDMIENASGGHDSLSNWYIYGNVFYWDSACDDCGIGDGEVGILVNDGHGTDFTGTLLLVNNTVAGVAPPSICTSGVPAGKACNAFMLFIDPGVVYKTATIISENNIFWDSGNLNAAYGTYDYNSYYGGVNNSSDRGAHKRVLGGDPFVNSRGCDYHLAADMSGSLAGTSFPSPYNVDVDGVTRGSDGTYDRGAYEYVAAQPPR